MPCCCRLGCCRAASIVMVPAARNPLRAILSTGVWASSRRRGQTGDRGGLNTMFTRVFDSLSTMSVAKGDEGIFHSALYALLWTLSPAVGTVSNEVALQHGRADIVIRCAHPRVET